MITRISKQEAKEIFNEGGIMKRYKCNYCHRSCVLEYASQPDRPPDICPCNSRVVRVKWTPINKPPAPEGEIVEAAKVCNAVPLSHPVQEDDEALLAFARTIQAAVDGLEEKYRHLKTAYSSHIMTFHISKSKNEPLPSDKPRARDERGDWHELKPGRSVFRCATHNQLLYHHSDQYYERHNRLKHHGYPIEAGHISPNLYWAYEDACTWLFDLDLPCDKEGDC